jgi:hypothetical protein
MLSYKGKKHVHDTFPSKPIAEISSKGKILATLQDVRDFT